MKKTANNIADGGIEKHSRFGRPEAMMAGTLGLVGAGLGYGGYKMHQKSKQDAMKQQDPRLGNAASAAATGGPVAALASRRKTASQIPSNPAERQQGNHEQMSQRYRNAGWGDEMAGQYATSANEAIRNRPKPGGLYRMSDEIDNFEVPQHPTEAPQPTGQPSEQQISPEQMAAIMAYMQQQGQQQRQQQRQQQLQQQQQQGEPKMAHMQKTASQIATAVLTKVGFSVSDEGHEYDAQMAKLLKQQYLDKARLMQERNILGVYNDEGNNDVSSFLKALRYNMSTAGGSGGHPVMDARHQAYVQKQHEAGDNAYNPFGGAFTPLSEEGERGTSGILSRFGKIE